MLSTVYFGTVDPARGTSLLIFAFIVVVIGGLGSLRGTAVSAVVVGLVQQYANYYASSGLGDLSVVLLLGIVLLVRPARALAERWRMRPTARSPSPPSLLVAARVRAEARASTSRSSSTAPLDSPGTLQLLALCLVFAGVALTYDLLFGFTGLLSFGHALYFAARRLPRRRRDDEVGLVVLARRSSFTAAVGLVLPLVLGAVSLRVGGIAFAMVTLAFAQAGNVLVNKNPHKLTGGEEGLGARLHKLPGRLRRHLQHEEPLLARARLRRRRLPRRALGGRLLAGPRLAGDPRERAARLGARAAAAPVQADGVRPRRRSWPRPAASSTCCCRAARRRA